MAACSLLCAFVLASTDALETHAPHLEQTNAASPVVFQIDHRTLARSAPPNLRCHLVERGGGVMLARDARQREFVEKCERIALRDWRASAVEHCDKINEVPLFREAGEATSGYN